MKEVIVYESHVTIDPVFDERLEQFKNICSDYRFRVAKLLMQKKALDFPVISEKDSFCTGHAPNQEELMNRMTSLCKELIDSGFVVRRYKIEAVVLDSRTKDVLGLLDDKT
jgi:hypothetical protein